jgi:hypothetical protein
LPKSHFKRFEQPNLVKNCLLWSLLPLWVTGAILENGMPKNRLSLTLAGAIVVLAGAIMALLACNTEEEKPQYMYALAYDRTGAGDILG